MSDHLLVATVGPVQEFIAQARRTRDLWYGSYILSEISRGVAATIAYNGQGAEAEAGRALLFPPIAIDPSRRASNLDPDLLIEWHATDKPRTSVSNRIVAIVSNPAEVAVKARAEARAALRALAEEVRQRNEQLVVPAADVEIMTKVWLEQVDTFLELLFAWSPIDDAGGFKGATQRVNQALAARKLLRDFSPWRQQRGDVPKSSLDGARETVLAKPGEDGSPNQKARRRLRIGPGEQLDALGLIKRAGGAPEQFVPISNIALSRWISGLSAVVPDKLARVATACSRVDGLGRINRARSHWTEQFPYDAQVLLPARLPSLAKEVDFGQDVRAWSRTFVEPLIEGRAPDPYVACIRADGDGIGDLLSSLSDAEQYRDLSKRLADFAVSVRAIVEGDHRGSLVYAGGDELLAFLPVTDTLDCAAAIARRFRMSMTDATGEHTPWLPPTLSVGIGIGHILESMGGLLDLARRAEKLAKNKNKAHPEGRGNGLGIIFDRRSGAPIEWRSRFLCEDGEFDVDGAARLLRDAMDLVSTTDGSRPRLSTRKVYEVQACLRPLPTEFEKIPEEDQAQLARLLRGDVTRTLARTEGGSGAEQEQRLTPDRVGLELDFAAYDQVWQAVDQWVRRMHIALRFAQAQAAIPRPAQSKAGGRS